MRLYLYSGLVLLALLAACGGAGDSSGADEAERQETVFDPMVETIDRTEEAVEEMEGRVDELNKRLEDIEE